MTNVIEFKPKPDDAKSKQSPGLRAALEFLEEWREGFFALEKRGATKEEHQRFCRNMRAKAERDLQLMGERMRAQRQHQEP